MAGGLVQIAVYGTQDIFLTGTPQITFFKLVYRRHTNFAIEPIPQYFIGDANFGQEMTSIIDKIGDLMSKIYLEIEIPKVDLLKNSTHWKKNYQEAKNDYEGIQKYYKIVNDYLAVNTDIARKIFILLKTNNISLDDIQKTMNNGNFINNLVSHRIQLQTYISNNDIDIDNTKHINSFNTVQQINRIDVHLVFNSVIKNFNNQKINNLPEELEFIKKQELIRIIEKTLYHEMYDFYINIYHIYVSKQKIYQSFLDGTYTERYQFAWVEELGHAIIDKIEIKIGGQVIDKHTGDWLILFNKIFIHEYQIDNYYKMIGNVKELTIFDDTVKNSYKLIIPFQFWFCRNYGLSIPLVALRYHDITINVLLKELSKVCYIEDNQNLPDMANIQSQYNINIINAKLYVDYIFLDSDERRRFAQSTHEYLIETVQYNEFDDIISKQHNAHLNFSHPTKFIIWFVQPKHYRENLTGRNKCQWNNFGTNPDKTGYTLKSAHLRLNSCDRTDPNTNIKFYNYVQPYLYFQHSPTDGFNVYSFALNPMEHQPSASINLSRIDDFGLMISFTNEFMELVKNGSINDNESGIYLGVYTISYNILRFMSGMTGVAFQQGI